MRFPRTIACCLLAVLLCAVPALAGNAADGAAVSERWYSQTVYVPVYSSVFFGNQKSKGPRTFNVAATVSLRNTDPATPITILEARYIGAEGAVLQQYVETPRVLAPLASMALSVDERDESGGVGASFLVRWKAEVPVTAPLMQAVMIGTQSSQGISFVTEGRALEGVRP